MESRLSGDLRLYEIFDLEKGIVYSKSFSRKVRMGLVAIDENGMSFSVNQKEIRYNYESDFEISKL